MATRSLTEDIISSCEEGFLYNLTGVCLFIWVSGLLQFTAGACVTLVVNFEALYQLCTHLVATGSLSGHTAHPKKVKCIAFIFLTS